MGAIFKRGYEAAREEKQRQDEVREKMGKQLWRFFLGSDGDEALVRFLTEEPVNFNEHTIKTTRNNKEHYDTFICTGDDCPYCKNGDRPSFKGAFLIIDKRPYSYTDKKTGKTKKGDAQVRLYVQGTRVLSQLDRLSSRYGLTSRDYLISRSGKGTSTSYIIDRTDDIGKMTEEEIRSILPDKIRDDYDGTMESLYQIVQSQLEMSISSDGDFEDPEDEDDDGDGSSDLIPSDEDEEKEPSRHQVSSVKKRGLFKKVSH